MKPSPVTVTVSFVSAVPSYSFVSVALVIVTDRVVIVSVPYVGVTVSYWSSFSST